MGAARPRPTAGKNLFDGPCQLHDFGYRNFGKGLTLRRNEDTRAWIDGRFEAEMKRLCNNNFPHIWQIPNREACFKEAEVIWAGVRNGSFFGNDWSKPLPTTGSPVTGPAPAPAVSLAQGPAAPAGFRYSIALQGFPPATPVSVTCYDSVSPAGFYTFSLTTDGSGAATTAAQCYSGDGPEHWAQAGGVQSNRVSWGGSPGPTPPPPVPPPPPPPPPTYPETTGGAANTWTNYTNAGGYQGPTIAAYATVQIACKLQGFRVADGNTWW
jgi:hypothetical protein